MSKTPATGAAQPDIEAASRQNPSPIAGGEQERARAGAPESAESAGSARLERDSVSDQHVGAFSPQHPHLFHLAGASTDTFEGGTLQGATQENWKILSGQRGSVYLARLKPGGIREPHWHTSAWELSFVISGRARWSFLGPKGTHDTFVAEKGDLVFAPQGHFHYFENASDTEELVALLIFNTSASEPEDDIGIVESLSTIPPETLAAVFDTSVQAFRNVPRKLERITLARHSQSEQSSGVFAGALKRLLGTDSS